MCMKPSENADRYKLPMNVDDMIKFTDNLIHYRKKLIDKGERKPIDPLVYVNKALEVKDGKPDESYKLTRAY
jgi:hypothetical protein